MRARLCVGTNLLWTSAPLPEAHANFDRQELRLERPHRERPHRVTVHRDLAKEKIERINTSSAPLTIRQGASTATAALGSIADGATVTIKCQKIGQAVSGTYGTSKLWDKIGAGYVADAYVSTGSDGRVAPDCP